MTPYQWRLVVRFMFEAIYRLNRLRGGVVDGEKNLERDLLKELEKTSPNEGERP